MAKSKQLWSPLTNGLSLSGLEMWLCDRVAFELQYLRNLEVVETWNKNMQYGSLVQSGIEGFIKTRQTAVADRFIDIETEKQIAAYDDAEEICWWAALAKATVKQFIGHYEKDLQKYGIAKSEEHHKVDLTLPSGRTMVIHGYLDGHGPDNMMENKCRGDWDTESITAEIDRNLQLNYYMLLYKATHGKLPKFVWYQHIRRPLSFGYRGPARRKSESRDDHRERIIEHMAENKGYYFFRYLVRPNEEMIDRFLNECLIPILESFLDWYQYMTSPNKKDIVNRFHWITPYGLYNPFMEGTAEKFRTYRLTGSTLGLRPRINR